MFCRLFVSLIRKGVGHVPKKSWRWGDSLDQCSGEARKHGDVKAVLLLYAFQGNLSASSCRVHQAFEDHSLNECLARHLVQKSRRSVTLWCIPKVPATIPRWWAPEGGQSGRACWTFPGFWWNRLNLHHIGKEWTCGYPIHCEKPTSNNSLLLLHFRHSNVPIF